MRVDREDVGLFVFLVTDVVKTGEKKGGIDRNDLGRRRHGDAFHSDDGKVLRRDGGGW